MSLDAYPDGNCRKATSAHRQHWLGLITSRQDSDAFWEFAFSTVVFLYNRTPSMILSGETPFKIMYKKSPNYVDLRVFECMVYPNLRPMQRHKFTFRSQPHVFLGYPNSHKGYLCFNPLTNKFIISRDCIFINPILVKTPN